jgi:hypothetical protein
MIDNCQFCKWRVCSPFGQLPGQPRNCPDASSGSPKAARPPLPGPGYVDPGAPPARMRVQVQVRLDPLSETPLYKAI